VKVPYASLFRRERIGRLADGGGESGHVIEHDVQDAGVSRDAVHEPEEEVIDVREWAGWERRGLIGASWRGGMLGGAMGRGRHRWT
jgi:hypothetical protein